MPPLDGHLDTFNSLFFCIIAACAKTLVLVLFAMHQASPIVISVKSFILPCLLHHIKGIAKKLNYTKGSTTKNISFEQSL